MNVRSIGVKERINGVERVRRSKAGLKLKLIIGP